MSFITEHQTCSSAFAGTWRPSSTMPKHNAIIVWAWVTARLCINKTANQTPGHSSGEWWVLLFLVTKHCYCLGCWWPGGNNAKRANRRPSLYCKKKQWSCAWLSSIAAFTYLSDNRSVYSFIPTNGSPSVKRFLGIGVFKEIINRNQHNLI